MVGNKPLLLGIDVGTSGTKSMIVDATGNILGSGFKAYGHNSPQPGWVEQEPIWYVDAIRESAAQALAESGGKWADVCGLSMTHQRLTFIPVNKKGEPVYPAIVWNDTRCSEEARWASDTIGAETIFHRTGYPPGIWSVYKVLWLKNHCPDIYEKSSQFHMVSD